MNFGKLGDLAVGTAGDVAGSVVDPKTGLGRIRSAVTPGLMPGVPASVTRASFLPD